MKTMLISMAAAGLLAAGAASAQSGADVLKAKGCLNCHDMSKKKMGPSFKDIAAKYKGDANAAATLADKIKSGKGHPKSTASDAELKSALEHALAAN